MRNSKKLLCMLLSLIMVFSVFTVAAVPASAYNTDGVIYFDAASAGWSGASWISFYIYDLSNYESVTVWGSNNKSFTTHGGDIWAFNAKEAGVLLGHEYGIIFENLDTTAYTADLLFNYSCFGDTAYVPDPDDMIENAVDSNKKSMKAAWKNSSLGCIKQITSLGNIVGDIIPGTTSAYQMMVNFLASKGIQSLINALDFNGKDAQTTIDDIAKELGLSKDDVEKAIYEAAEIGTNDGSGDKTDWSHKWDKSKSTLEDGSGGSGVGVKVSGKIRSYLSDTDPISVLLMQNGKVKKNVNVKGNSAEYSFDDVKAGTYTMLVTKKNHVNREYTVTVADTDVTKDVEICPLGDVTGDGKTNVQDCTAILRYVRKLDMDLSDYQLKCADVTGDNKVNVQDVTKILRHVRKIEALY